MVLEGINFMGFLEILFVISAVTTIASAIGVTFARNIMHACVYLLGSLIGIAGLYLTLGADFVAAVQLVVYIGGVVILMLFAVMLTGGKDFVSKVQKFNDMPDSMGSKWTYTIGALFSLIISSMGLFLIFRTSTLESKKVLSGFSSTVEEIGTQLVTKYVLAFELSSILLLGALIGAAIIARPKKNVEVEEIIK